MPATLKTQTEIPTIAKAARQMCAALMVLLTDPAIVMDPTARAQAQAATDGFERLQFGYTIAEMEAAFKAVQDLVNWKAPINAVIERDKLDLTLRAIEFYTGTKGLWVPAGTDGSMVRVRAQGYAAGPAGDH